MAQMDIDRIAPTRRPEGLCAWYHKWRSLLFMHWEVPAELIRAKLPPELTLDTYNGRAFVGLVPFTMMGIRPRWLPYLPGASDFHETNVRTYVHYKGQDPGVWFFSLDAANPFAVMGARVGWSLPYFLATMSMQHEGSRVVYSTNRVAPAPTPAQLDMSWDIGEQLGPTQPGTLEHFLAERYFLYAKHGETLYRGRVYHTPYPLRKARIERMNQSMLSAAGFEVEERPFSVLYSPGVDVDVFDLEKVAL